MFTTRSKIGKYLVKIVINSTLNSSDLRDFYFRISRRRLIIKVFINKRFDSALNHLSWLERVSGSDLISTLIEALSAYEQTFYL